MTSHICGALRIDGKSCNNPVANEGNLRCWRHRAPMDVSSQLMPGSSEYFINAYLTLPETASSPGQLRSWAEFALVESEKNSKVNELLWLRTVVTNWCSPQLSYNGKMAGATLVEIPIGEGYAMHVMDTLCPNECFSVVTEPNESAYETISMSTLSWSSADVTTSIHLIGGSTFGIEGLEILASSKTGKRLKEITRISKHHCVFGAGEITVSVYDGPEIPNDGCSIIRPSLLDKLARTNSERAYLRKHVRSGNLRVILDFGLIKGDFIIARRDSDIEADIVTHQANVKGELKWTGSQGRAMVGIMPHHDLYRPMTNVQTLSWAGEVLFPADRLMRELKRAGAKVLADLLSGVYPSYLQYDGPTGADLDSRALLTGTTNLDNHSAMYERWLKAGRSLNESSYFLFMIGNSFLEMNKKKPLGFPVPWASGSHIISHELLARAGYGDDLKDREDLVFYHKATGRISLPGKLVELLYDNHGGWDLDDSIQLLLRKFEDSVIRGIIFRTPNGRGEYSVVEVDYASFDDADAIFHREGTIPKLTSVADLKDVLPPIQRISALIGYRGLPESSSIHLNGGPWTREAAEESRAVMSIAPGVGQWANMVMVSNTVASGPHSGAFGPKDQLAPGEAIVDALQQGASAEVYAAIWDWIEEIGKAIDGRKVDAFFTDVDYRLPANVSARGDKDGYMFKLAIAKQRYLASSRERLLDVSAHLRKPIVGLLDQPVDQAYRQWAIKVVKKYSALNASAPNNTIKYSFKESGVSGISRIVKRKLSQDYWESNAQALVSKVTNSGDPGGLTLALYQYTVQCQLEYKRDRGVDRPLFASAGAGQVTMMDLLLEVLADLELPEKENKS